VPPDKALNPTVRRRGWFLTVAAALFLLLAISNFLKPVMASSGTGFVFFGHRLAGLSNDILGPLFGVLLVIYAAAIWRLWRFAIVLGWAYAGYVAANMTLYSIYNLPDAPSASLLMQSIVSFAIGLGVPLAAAIVLTARRADLS
jgi:hypothetical protein